jgi:D-arabinose 1-dehydrogenase-like Zn-dependent alcohol dehydrogenase
MKAAVFYQPNLPVSIEDLGIEALQEGDVLLDVVAAGVSHSDYHLIRGRRAPKEVMLYGRFLASQQS